MFEEGARDEDPTRDSTIAPLHSTISVPDMEVWGDKLYGGEPGHTTHSHTRATPPPRSVCLGYPPRQVAARVFSIAFAAPGTQGV